MMPVGRRLYIAGPYTHGAGGVWNNVEVAMAAAHTAMDLGLHPYLPHLSHFMHLRRERPYSEWMDLDLAWLRKANGLWRLPGYSPGADLEVKAAQGCGIPCFFSRDEVEGWTTRLKGLEVCLGG